MTLFPYIMMVLKVSMIPLHQFQGRIQDFFWEGVHSSLALLQHQILLQNTSCIRKPQVISGGRGGGRGGAHPLHPPPRSAPEFKQAPWYYDNLRQAKRDKRRLERKFRSLHGLTVDKQQFELKCSEYKSLLETSKRN